MDYVLTLVAAARKHTWETKIQLITYIGIIISSTESTVSKEPRLKPNLNPYQLFRNVHLTQEPRLHIHPYIAFTFLYITDFVIVRCRSRPSISILFFEFKNQENYAPQNSYIYCFSAASFTGPKHCIIGLHTNWWWQLIFIEKALNKRFLDSDIGKVIPF